MAAENRYLEAFNQYSSGVGSRKELARSFIMDSVEKLYDQHMDERDQAQSLINLGTASAAVPGALKTINDARKNVGARFASQRAGRPNPANFRKPLSAPDESGTEMQARTNKMTSTRPLREQISDPAGSYGDEFGPSSQAIDSSAPPPETNLPVADTTVADTTVARTGATAEESAVSAGRQLMTSSARLVGKISTNIAQTGGRIGNALGDASRAVGNLASDASAAATEAATAASTAISTGARAVLGDSVVDGLIATGGILGELAGPLSLLSLLGIGAYDLYKAFSKKPIDTNPKVPINTQKSAIVAPSIDATLQQTTVASAF